MSRFLIIILSIAIGWLAAVTPASADALLVLRCERVVGAPSLPVIFVANDDGSNILITQKDAVQLVTKSVTNDQNGDVKIINLYGSDGRVIELWYNYSKVIQHKIEGNKYVVTQFECDIVHK